MGGSDFDPYEVLGAAHEATPEGLKRLYRDLTKRHHPDKGGDRANWDRLTLAYEILSDPDRRAFFDQTGRIDMPRPEFDLQQANVIIAEALAVFADTYVKSHFDPLHDPRRQPVLEMVGERLRMELKEAENALQMGRTHQKFWHDYAKRIIRREGVDGLDQVAAIVQQKIKGIEQQVIHIEEVVRVRKVAIDVLADYSFERDSKAPAAYTVTTPFLFDWRDRSVL